MDYSDYMNSIQDKTGAAKAADRIGNERQSYCHTISHRRWSSKWDAEGLIAWLNLNLISRYEEIL
jgi:hypothetical protein